ncbi:MAG: hypothetical protein AB2A00_00565 [Myxococcota bacterium]
MSTPLRLLSWAVLGTVVGTSLDALHVVTGVLSYAHPTLGVQAWWVPLLFAGAGLALGEGHHQVASRLAGRKLPPASTAEMIRGLLFLVGVYGSSGFIQAWPYPALALYVVLFAVAVLLTPGDARPALMLHAAGAALLGPVVESTISSTGAFWYNHPDLFNVTVWLPGIYLHTAVASAAWDRWLPSRT